MFDSDDDKKQRNRTLSSMTKMQRAQVELNLAYFLLDLDYVVSEDMAMSMACAAIDAGYRHINKLNTEDNYA